MNMTSLSDPLRLLADLPASMRDRAGQLRDVLSGWQVDLPGVYDSGLVPESWYRGLAQTGVLGAAIPASYGGLGLDPLAYGLLILELERFDSGVRSFVSVTSALCAQAILKFGTESQKSTYLPKLARGEITGAFALTEPQGGSDPGGMQCSARHVGSTYVLSGTKHWITNGARGDIVVVWAKCEGKVLGFVVPQQAEGMRWQIVENKLSLRASQTCHLEMLDVVVDEQQCLTSQGLGAPLACLNEARFGIAFGAIGAATDCAEHTLAFADQRSLFGKKLSGFQISQTHFADFLASIAAMQLLAFRLADLKQKGQLTPAQVSLGKRQNVAAAVEIARACRSLLGAQGILGEQRVMRHMCNLESVSTYEGTHDVHSLVLGLEATGEAAFR